MRKLKIKLKQHTPLIHFQHDQEGATLRASEVKPKLDKYILTLLGEGDYEAGKSKAKDKRWIIGDHPALNFKMRIEAKDKIESVSLNVNSKFKKGKTLYETELFPFLLANMGGKEREEELMNLSMYDSVDVVLSIFKDDLFDEINKRIELFFAIHNFGQRQTKGFGSFTVVSKQVDDEEPQIVIWTSKTYYKSGTPIMKFQLIKEDKFERQRILFSVLDFYWRCLKSGINYTKRIPPRNGIGDVQIKNSERYIKSYLWTYLSQKKYTWEKRYLKREFGLETSYPVRQFADQSFKESFARGLMGCPDKYEYRIPQNDYYEDRSGRMKETNISETIDIKNKTGKIDRISSPIYFKPYISGNQATIYILFDDELIQQLINLPKEDRVYKFTCRNRPKEMSIIPETISYLELIKKFHNHIFTNMEFIRSTLGEYNNNKWTPAIIKISQNQDGKTVRKWGGIDMSWKMVPRDFNWKNILDPNDNGQNQYVSFAQIMK